MREVKITISIKPHKSRIIFFSVFYLNIIFSNFSFQKVKEAEVRPKCQRAGSEISEEPQTHSCAVWQCKAAVLTPHTHSHNHKAQAHSATQGKQGWLFLFFPAKTTKYKQALHKQHRRKQCQVCVSWRRIYFRAGSATQKGWSEQCVPAIPQHKHRSTRGAQLQSWHAGLSARKPLRSNNAYDQESLLCLTAPAQHYLIYSGCQFWSPHCGAGAGPGSSLLQLWSTRGLKLSSLKYFLQGAVGTRYNR